MTDVLDKLDWVREARKNRMNEASFRLLYDIVTLIDASFNEIALGVDTTKTSKGSVISVHEVRPFGFPKVGNLAGIDCQLEIPVPELFTGSSGPKGLVSLSLDEFLQLHYGLTVIQNHLEEYAADGLKGDLASIGAKARGKCTDKSIADYVSRFAEKVAMEARAFKNVDYRAELNALLLGDAAKRVKQVLASVEDFNSQIAAIAESHPQYRVYRQAESRDNEEEIANLLLQYAHSGAISIKPNPARLSETAKAMYASFQKLYGYTGSDFPRDFKDPVVWLARCKDSKILPPKGDELYRMASEEILRLKAKRA